MEVQEFEESPEAYDPNLAPEEPEVSLKRRVGRPRKVERPLQQLVVERDQALVDFLSSIGHGHDTLKVYVDRKQPKVWRDSHGNTHQIEGRVDTFDEPITEDDIKERHGGGTYAIAVQVKNDRGKWGYIQGGHKTIKISGEPNVRGIISDAGPAPALNAPESSSVVKTVMDTMNRQLERAETRGQDPAMAELLRGLREDAVELRRELAKKDERLLELIGRKPEESTADRLLGVMMTAESARIEALRTQHESELRVTRERLMADADRQFGVLQNQVATTERAHERELESLKRSYESQIEQLKLAHTGAKGGFEREVRHLDGLLTEAKAELIELRALKARTPMEMIKEVTALQEAFGKLGGKDEDEEEASSPIERIIGGVMNSPLAQGIAQRLAEGPGGAAPQAAAQPMTAETMPVNQAVRVGDKVLIKQPDGTIGEVQRKKKPTVEVKGGQKLVLNPTELKDVIKFMEAAVGRQDPATFASSVRHMIPADIQKAFAAGQGVDHFLDEVANLDPSSPLSTQSGRTWLREVAKHVFI